MLKANALFIVIVIAMVIGVFCSSLILISYHHRLQVQKDLLIKKLDLNAFSAINLLLSDSDIINFNEEKVIDLYEEERDSVLCKKMIWGVFEVAVVKAFSGINNCTKAVQYGYKPDELSSSAIYLTNGQHSLSLGGNTYIKGTCYLPEEGVDRAYIEGQAFSGVNLINGECKKSNNTLPELNKSVTDFLLNFIISSKESLPNIYQVESGVEKDTIVRSFIDKTLILYERGIVSLGGKNLSGNIIVCSDQYVIIDSSSKLDNILVFAPTVIVSDYFKGNLQIFSTDSIHIGVGCTFKYPSVLGLIKKDLKVIRPYIQIDNQTIFKGVIFTCIAEHSSEQTMINIGKDAQIEGQIYAEGSIDLKGSVFGNVTCNSFFLKTPSGQYPHHLLNATIDNSRLSPYFVGSSIMKFNKEKKVALWLE